MDPIRLLSADDHPMLIEGIKAQLRNAENIQVVGQALNGIEVISFVEKEPVDIILMDITMPLMDGIETTAYIVKHFPAIRVIMFSMHTEHVFISKSLKAGASGYVLKNTNMEELLCTISKVASGEVYFSNEVALVMMAQYMISASQQRGSSKSFIQDLTKRELEILNLIAQGMTSSEIAQRLFISVDTVDTHRKNLNRKIGVKNTAGLVKFALQQGLGKEE